MWHLQTLQREDIYRGKVTVKIQREGAFDGVLAMLPQNPRSLFVKKTVREELEEMVDVRTKETTRRLAETTEICEIEDLLDSHPTIFRRRGAGV